MFVSRAHHTEVCAQWREITITQAKQLREAQERYDALLAKYHELRVGGANPEQRLPDPPKSPLDALGPLTRAALREMSTGLTATNRRAMEAVALSLHADGWPDEQLASTVRAGESLRQNTPPLSAFKPNGNGKR